MSIWHACRFVHYSATHYSIVHVRNIWGMRAVWGLKRKRPDVDLMDATGLKFFEVSVAPDETWTVWNSKTMPLLFPGSTFRYFLRLTLGAEADAQFGQTMFRSMMSAKGVNKQQQERERVLEETFDQLDQAIHRQQRDTMDQFVRFPTFAFFADDAVKALRAVVTAKRRIQLRKQTWTEVAVAANGRGTLISEKNPLSDELQPVAFLPNSTVRVVEGTAWAATAYQLGSCFSTDKNMFYEPSPIETKEFADRGRIAEFAITVIDDAIETFGLDPTADWQGLTDRFIPAQIKFAGISPIDVIPRVNLHSKVGLDEQVKALIKWAYLNGILCRLLWWLDNAFRK